jgi:archaellum component FlaC
MAESVDNLVLEQLRLIREQLGRMEGRIDGLAADMRDLRDEMGGLEAKIDGNSGVLIGLGHYIHSIDERVENLEQKIGGPQ